MTDIEKLQKIVEDLKIDKNFAVHNIKETFNHISAITTNFTKSAKWQKEVEKSLEHSSPTYKKLINQVQKLSETEPALTHSEKPKRSPN